MIITRTPFRISFFGGGTDYPIWYKKNGGSVLSTSINKYCYITCRPLPPFFDYKYRVAYSKLETSKNTKNIEHPSVRELLNFVDLKNIGVSISYDADLPARSGLGSSSAFTVGLLNALHGLKGQIRNKYQLAMDAIHVEQKLIKENVGSQDQVIAAYGGLNRIDFANGGDITVLPITISQKRLKELQDSLMIFFTGFSRNASDIAAEQIKMTLTKNNELKLMHQMVDQALEILNSNQNINKFGELLHESWQIKRQLTPKISNPAIDKIYETAIKTGATGGKLLGAGGGGFMLIFAQPKYQKKIRQKLGKLIHVPFAFENSGSRVIYYSTNDLVDAF